MKIRRNATKKIRAIAARAIRVQAYNHSSSEAARPLEGDAIETALAEWIEWARNRGPRSSCSADLNEAEKRYGSKLPGGRLELRSQTVLRLSFHTNAGLEFLLTDEPAGETTVHAAPYGMRDDA
jgi:hypothetical protein